MKTIGLVLSVALTLCTGTLNARAHGGSCGECFFWPFMAFGLGLALASSSHASTVTYYPVYALPPGPVYSPQAPSAEFMQPPAPVVTSWIPSTPGAGKWVPDAQPYRYAPGTATITRPASASAKTVAVVPIHLEGSPSISSRTLSPAALSRDCSNWKKRKKRKPERELGKSLSIASPGVLSRDKSVEFLIAPNSANLR